ncbi:hypothetical protein [Hydrogenophaga sp.]|uniref:hypothetical protein n=1 Tax=Hydrogenophaga sp. TaxID=1904254 RepID=UPI002728E31D|nr:hypothetical protein [Hydrogenophaga sp.]MDO9436826.1 hypothetical protein [Hydrogenophaga sp.]
MRLDPATPDGVYTRLVASFKQPPFPGTPLATVVFELSQGRLQGDAYEVKLAINALLIQEEFAAFAETFNLFTDLQEAQARQKGQPFTREFHPEIPSGWVPTDLQALADAMRSLRVSRVQVDDRSADVVRGAAPKALSLCLEALLLAGRITELEINMPLTEPTSLANALAKSQLNSVKLWARFSGTQALQVNELETAAAVLDGLGSCGTLKHLFLGHGELVALQPCIEAWTRNPQGPRLESIDLWKAWGLQRRDEEIPVNFETLHRHFDAFMVTIASIKTLQALTVKVGHESVQALETQVLAPLRDHPSLKALDINTGGRCLRRKTENLEALLRVLRFTVSCASLKHFAWRTQDVYGEDAEEEILQLVNLVRELHPTLSTEDILGQAALREELQVLLVSAAFRLESLVLQGLTFFTGAIEAFFDAFKTNRTLKHVDLFDCKFPINAIRVLLMALKHNPTLITGRLPDDYKDFCLVGTGDHLQLYGFRTTDNDMNVNAVHDFMLKLAQADVYINGQGDYEDDSIDEVASAEANEAFDPYRQIASTMYTTFYDRLADNRRWQLTRPLDAVMQSFIASTDLGNISNPDVAQSLVDALANAGAWPTLVHLSELNKATASHGIQEGALRQELMRQVRTERWAARTVSAARRAEVGFVDNALSDAAVSTTLAHERFDAVRAELKRGLTDSDGGIALMSVSASVREALRVARAPAARAAAALAGDGVKDTTFQDE